MEKINHVMQSVMMRGFYDKCMELQNTKGKDYTTQEDAFKDTIEEAIAMDISPEKMLFIFMNKHFKAVRNYCRYGQTQSEPIQGRLMDLANYIALLATLIELKNK